MVNPSSAELEEATEKLFQGTLCFSLIRAILFLSWTLARKWLGSSGLVGLVLACCVDTLSVSLAGKHNQAKLQLQGLSEESMLTKLFSVWWITMLSSAC